MADPTRPPGPGEASRFWHRRITRGESLLGVALVLGFVLRLAPSMLTDFPLEDGGLFVRMALDIRDAGFGIPMFSTFNGGEVPFAYPPVGLFILAAIPGDPVVTERWLPLVWSVAAIPFAYLLARELTDDTRAGVAAVVFAAMPASWAIEGGGVTRALSLALLLAALWRIARVLRLPSLSDAMIAGALAGLALLTHPGVGPTGLVSAVVLLGYRLSVRSVISLSAATAMTIACMAPWIAFVVQRYGLGSLQSAAQAHHTEESLGRLLTIGPSWSGALDPILPLAALGMVVAIHRREWLLPVWTLAAVLVPGGEGRYAAIMWAMLATSGVLTVAIALRQIGAIRIAGQVALVWLFATGLMAGYQRFDAIPRNVREAMIDAGARTPEGTAFAVVVHDGGLEGPVLDWFPTLSHRESLGTFVGLEWTTVDKWDARVALQRSIQTGTIPADADALFVVEGGVAHWELLAARDSGQTVSRAVR